LNARSLSATLIDVNLAGSLRILNEVSSGDICVLATTADATNAAENVDFVLPVEYKPAPIHNIGEPPSAWRKGLLFSATAPDATWRAHVIIQVYPCFLGSV